MFVMIVLMVVVVVVVFVMLVAVVFGLRQLRHWHTVVLADVGLFAIVQIVVVDFARADDAAAASVWRSFLCQRCGRRDDRRCGTITYVELSFGVCDSLCRVSRVLGVRINIGHIVDILCR